MSSKDRFAGRTVADRTVGYELIEARRHNHPKAHSTDGWHVPESGWSILRDATDAEERKAAAAQTCSMLKLPFPVVVDGMDDAVAQRWSAWPERLFAIGVDGRVAYVGEQGPWGFWPLAESSPDGWGEDHGNDHGEPLDTFLERFLV